MTPGEAAELVGRNKYNIDHIEGKLNTLILTHDIQLTTSWLKQFVTYLDLSNVASVQVVASAIMTYNNKAKD